MLPGEPAGRIFVKNAGTFEFRACLTWRSAEEVPGRQLQEISSRTGLRVSSQEDGPGCEIGGRLSVFDERDAGEVLGSALRHITNVASVSEAVLEARVVKVASPAAPEAGVACDLARHLWEAGVRVTFGRTETPLFGADVALGTGSSNGDLESIVSQRGPWETVGAEFG